MERYAGGRRAQSTESSALSPTRSAKKAKKKSTASSRRAKPRLVSFTLSRKNPPELTEDEKRQLEYTRNLPDDRIDTSDIPELPDMEWRPRTVYIGLSPGPGRKKSVTIRLDEDVVRWFKKQGKGWQTKMNWVLRLYFASHRKTDVKVGRP